MKKSLYLGAVALALLVGCPAFADGVNKIVYDVIEPPVLVEAEPVPVKARPAPPPAPEYVYSSATYIVGGEDRVVAVQGVHLPVPDCPTDTYSLAMSVAGVTSTKFIVQRNAPIVVGVSYSHRIN